MKLRIPAILLFAFFLAACEPALEPNDYRDYTPPKIVAMYPSETSGILIPSNRPFYIQFDDRMDPAIAAYDSDALVLDNISAGERVPLTFQLVNEDTCLIASFNPDSLKPGHVYMLRINPSMRNYSRIALPNPDLYDQGFIFEGVYPSIEPAFSLTSPTNNSWGGLDIRLSGTCTGIETISVYFTKYARETEQTFRLDYGVTNWTIVYPVDPAVMWESTFTLNLVAAPYYTPNRITRGIDLKLDLEPPRYLVEWPQPGSVVSNTLPVTLAAVDNLGLERVLVKIGESNWIPMTTFPDWVLPVDTTILSNGVTSLEVSLLDRAGNSNHYSSTFIISNQ